MSGVGIKILIDEDIKRRNYTDHAARSILTKVLMQLVDQGKVTKGQLIGMVIDTNP